MPNILVAVDDWALRELLHLLLEDRGYVVSVSEHSADTLEIMEEALQPMVAVLDLAPADGDGLTVVRAVLRDWEQAFRHEFILLTQPQQPLPADVWPLIEALSIPVLCKPLDLDELFEIVGLLSATLRGSFSGAGPHRP